MVTPAMPSSRTPDWEAFYRDYRKPGYVSGFEITTKLGGGMFGLVFRARKQSIGKDYAIKFLQVDDTEVRRAVVAELEQVKWFAQIDHPNLVSIEDRGEVDGIPYLVMSFAGTETLRDRMALDGKVPSPEQRDELVRYFLQCCRGLSALHERSLVHFDIKPANVFLKGPVARLGDYGLSKLVTHSRGSLSMGRGTPYYMAPEMLQRRGDARSDVYSLGVMLYEILCGKVPFTGDSEWEVLQKHEKEAPVMPPHLSPLERAVLQRCLQKDPAARFQSVHDLIAAFGGEDAPAAVPPPLPAANTPDLPHCVPPPLPAVLPPPVRSAGVPAAMVRQRPAVRRGLGVGTLLLAFVVLLGFMLMVNGVRSRGMSQSASAFAFAPMPIQVETAPMPTGLAQQVDQMIAAVHQSMRGAQRRKQVPALEALDVEALAAPADLGAIVDRVESLAKGQFGSGHLRRFEQWGRSAFLAGVSLLQEFDYESAEDCRRAANLHQLLGGMTAVDGLRLDAVAGDPTTADACRFAMVADGWRQLAERFATDDETFRRLLVAKGRVAAGVAR